MADIALSLTLDDAGYQAGAKRVIDANAKMSGSQEKIGPATTRAAQSFDRLRRSLDPVYDASKKLEKATRDADAAIRAGIASTADKERVLAKLQSRLDPAARDMRGLARASDELRDHLGGLEGHAGVIGSMLSALGPAGRIAGIGIGAVVQLTVEDAWTLAQAITKFIAAQYVLGQIPASGRA